MKNCNGGAKGLTFFEASNIIDKVEFENYYRTHVEEEICSYFNIGAAVLSKLLKYFNITIKNKYENAEIEKRRFEDKYGEGNTCSNYIPEIVNKMRLTYEFEGIKFDSSWELALWIYAKDHNEEIEREPIKLNYYINGNKHSYIPDFLYKGNLIDIKGNHLLNSEGELITCYSNKGKLDEAKLKCIKDNNVIIYSESDIEPMLDYCKSKYSSNSWYKQFKVNKYRGKIYNKI